jgi:hypothetical protein
VVLPAVVLVSGSIGFRGLAAIAAGNVTAGRHEFLQMFIVATLVVAGPSSVTPSSGRSERCGRSGPYGLEPAEAARSRQF